MTKTILVCGHGPGISDAVAKKFGAEGFAVGLVARSADKLTAAVGRLQQKGIKAAGFPADVGDVKALRGVVARVRASLGPVSVLHWNASARLAGDLASADPNDLRKVLDVAVTGLVAMVQAVLPDLRTQPDPAVLVTGGGFALYDQKADAMAAQWNSMGLAVGKAAQHKLVGLLAERLRPEKVFVGEVTVMSLVKGTAFDSGQATLEAAAVADRFWELYRGRAQRYVEIR